MFPSTRHRRKTIPACWFPEKHWDRTRRHIYWIVTRELTLTFPMTVGPSLRARYGTGMKGRGNPLFVDTRSVGTMTGGGGGKGAGDDAPETRALSSWSLVSAAVYTLVLLWIGLACSSWLAEDPEDEHPPPSATSTTSTTSTTSSSWSLLLLRQWLLRVLSRNTEAVHVETRCACACEWECDAL